MGTNQSHEHQQEFNEKDWKEVQLVSYTNNPDPYYQSRFKVLAHRIKNYLHAQKYCLFFNSKAEYLSYLQLYPIRKSSPSLVNPYFIKESTEKNICSTFLSVSLYLERIPLRLAEIIDVPIQQGVYMLECSFEGYEIIFQKTGFFEVSSEMIGVNHQGKVKVWLNKNFSKNFPEFHVIDHNLCQIDFIKKIIETIEETIDYGKLEKFSSFLRRKYPHLTFSNSKKALRQFCKTYNIVPAKLMKSVLIIFKGNFNYEQKTNQKQHLNKKITSFNLARKNSFGRLFPQKNTKQNVIKHFSPTKTFHGSFNNRNHQFFEIEPRVKTSIEKRKSKKSFFSRNTGLYSPQTHEKNKLSKQEPKKTITEMKEKGNGLMKKRLQREKLYFSYQKMMEVDPEIVKDLQELNF